MAMNLGELRRIYARFDVAHVPLPEEYIDFDDTRGEPVLDRLRDVFTFADSSRPVTRLFSGGRGCGKTTELLRLREQLESQGFVVVYVDVAESVDINNCDFIDYVVASISGIHAGLSQLNVPGFSTQQTYLRSS